MTCRKDFPSTTSKKKEKKASAIDPLLCVCVCVSVEKRVVFQSNCDDEMTSSCWKKEEWREDKRIWFPSLEKLRGIFKEILHNPA